MAKKYSELLKDIEVNTSDLDKKAAELVKSGRLSKEKAEQYKRRLINVRKYKSLMRKKKAENRKKHSKELKSKKISATMTKHYLRKKR